MKFSAPREERGTERGLEKETRPFHYSSRVKVAALAQLTSSVESLLESRVCVFMHTCFPIAIRTLHDAIERARFQLIKIISHTYTNFQKNV